LSFGFHSQDGSKESDKKEGERYLCH
jgi:hypothetical protein